MTNPTERPTARQTVRDDAEAFGWELRTILDRYDIFSRDEGSKVIIGWMTQDPDSCALGAWLEGPDGGVAGRDTSVMCIVRAREWLRGSTDLLAPAPARTREN